MRVAAETEVPDPQAREGGEVDGAEEALARALQGVCQPLMPDRRTRLRNSPFLFSA